MLAYPKHSINVSSITVGNNVFFFALGLMFQPVKMFINFWFCHILCLLLDSVLGQEHKEVFLPHMWSSLTHQEHESGEEPGSAGLWS